MPKTIKNYCEVLFFLYLAMNMPLHSPTVL